MKQEVNKKNNAENREKQDEQRPLPLAPLDPYTGEVEPPAEGAYRVIEVMPVEPEDGNKIYLSEEEEPMDAVAADAQAEAVAQQITRFTDEEGIREEFEERQRLSSPGRKQLIEHMEEAHQSQTPDLTGGDLDAAWEDAIQAGDETVGGTVMTPDQDIVENLGEAVGLTYADDEPLNTEEKLLQRDRKRWELNPASADDEETEDEGEI